MLRAIAVPVFLTLLSTSALAATLTGEIDWTRQPFYGVPVTLVGENGMPSKTRACTQSNGKFNFDNVIPGNYTLRIWQGEGRDGLYYRTIRVQIVVPNGNLEIPTVDVANSTIDAVPQVPPDNLRCPIFM